MAPFASRACLVLVAAYACGSARVRAEPRTDARAHFDQAITLADQNRLSEALAEFQRVYELQKHPTVLYNIAHAYARLGRPVEALDTFSRYLGEFGTDIGAERRTAVEAEMERQRQRIGTLSIVAAQGATVRIDDREVASTAEPIRLGAGKHSIEISKSGYGNVVRTFNVEGRQSTEVVIVLAPLRAAESGDVRLVKVNCSVPGVAVWVDGKVVAMTPVQFGIPLGRGPHDIQFTRRGYAFARQKTNVQGHTVGIPCVPRSRSSGPSGTTGRLIVRASPVDAYLTIDGSRAGLSSTMPEGMHTLRLERFGYRPWTSSIDLVAGRTAEIVATLEVMPEYRNTIRATRQRLSNWSYIVGGIGTAAIGSAVGLYVWNDDRAGHWRRTQNGLDAEWSAPPYPIDLPVRQGENDSLATSIHRADAGVVGLFASGGAMLVTAVALYWMGQLESVQGPVRIGSQGPSASGLRLVW